MASIKDAPVSFQMPVIVGSENGILKISHYTVEQHKNIYQPAQILSNPAVVSISSLASLQNSIIYTTHRTRTTL